MGNNHSRIRFATKQSKSKQQLPASDLTLSDEDNKELICYLSNNSDDVDRQHARQFFTKFLFQSHFSSPIEDRLIQGECKVLDVGCGPGTWLLNVSSEYKNSNFFGVDAKPLFPQEIKPANLEFIEGDIYDGLPFKDEEFDFVHMESMVFVIARDQWNSIFSELVRVTKRGGYIELAESYVKYDDIGPVLYKLHEGIYSACLKRNVDIKLIPNLDSILESQPNIGKFHRDEKKVITGPNGDTIGLVCQDLYLSLFNSETIMKILCSELEISKEQYKNMIEKDFVEELKHTKPSSNLIRFWTQKN